MTKPLILFLPCPAGVEEFLADEVYGLTGLAGNDLTLLRGGVRVSADWHTMLRLNLMSRLAQRVLVEVARGPYYDEQDIYALAYDMAWETWFTERQTFRVDLTAQASPLRSLNFAALRIKDAVVDRFRDRTGGQRPSVDTHAPQVRVQAHLTVDYATLYLDTSGEPLFKRGWRQDKGDAPLKETLAAAMLAACGWWQPATRQVSQLPLYDPCCGSGTIVIEAAQLALGLAPGRQRGFGFEHLLPLRDAERAETWRALRQQAAAVQAAPGAQVRIFGSDVAHRMVDFAQRNAKRAGVSVALQLRGGDALQRMPPTVEPGVLLMNPPYGERIAVAGVAGARMGRQRFESEYEDEGEGEGVGAGMDEGDQFFLRLAAHWKNHYAGWTAWLLTPDRQLPRRLRMSASRRVPLWNGPIECRLLRFDIGQQKEDGQPKPLQRPP